MKSLSWSLESMAPLLPTGGSVERCDALLLLGFPPAGEGPLGDDGDGIAEPAGNLNLEAIVGVH